MQKFILKGQMCPVCAGKIERELQANKDVKKLSFDKTNFVVTAEGNNLKAIITDAVNKYEPGVEVLEDSNEEEDTSNRRKFNFSDATLFTGIFFIILSFIFKNNYLSIAGAVFAGFPILGDGLKVVFSGGGLDERFLMSVSMIGAILIGDAFEGAMIMILYRLGEAVSDFALKKANDRFKKLIVSQKVDARILGEDGNSKIVDVESVLIGTKIIVHPLEMVPLDSVVLDEYVRVDNSSFTGESDPIIVYNGEKILAGAIVLNETANLKTVSDYENSSLFRMKSLLDRASASKSKQEKFLTTFSKIYTPVVVIAAICLAMIPLFNGADFREYIYKALSFLVVACPCALVLGVPLSYAVGIAALSTKGVLMKGSEYIDTLSHINHLAMDKTGTVTENYLTIDRVVETSNIKEDELRRLMAIGEKHSKHPIARGFKMEDMPDPENYSETPGVGIDFSFEEVDYKIRGGELSGEINLIRNDEVVGKFFMVEKIKPNANEVISKLKNMKIKSVLVSGDRDEKVKYVSNILSIDEYYSEQSPEDKLNYVQSIKKHGKIGFVGDGINDSPVLKAADVGISMGNMGSDAAIESSDVVITDDSIFKVATTIKDAKSIMFNVKFIITFVLTVKLLTMVLIYLGFGGMYLAVFADVGLSILSIGIALLNMRLRRQ